jgi:hypothetical protein
VGHPLGAARRLTSLVGSTSQSARRGNPTATIACQTKSTRDCQPPASKVRMHGKAARRVSGGPNGVKWKKPRKVGRNLVRSLPISPDPRRRSLPCWEKVCLVWGHHCFGRITCAKSTGYSLQILREFFARRVRNTRKAAPVFAFAQTLRRRACEYPKSRILQNVPTSCRGAALAGADSLNRGMSQEVISDRTQRTNLYSCA